MNIPNHPPDAKFNAGAVRFEANVQARRTKIEKEYLLWKLEFDYSAEPGPQHGALWQ